MGVGQTGRLGLTCIHWILRWCCGKKSSCQCRCKRCRFDPWVRKIPWRRKWQLAPVFLPGKFHGQRSLEGYSPWGCTESDTAERLNTHTRAHTHTHTHIYTLPCVKQLASGKLLYSTESSVQCSVINQKHGMVGVGGRCKREGLYVCLQLIHFIVQQKLTQHCKKKCFNKKNKMKQN